MPFKFSGTLNKVVIDLGADGLTPEKHGELKRLQWEYAMRVQSRAIVLIGNSRVELARGTDSAG